MLKRVDNCTFSVFYKPVWRRSHVMAYLQIGKQQHEIGYLTTEDWQQLRAKTMHPRFLKKVGVRNYWYYDGQFWSDDDNLKPDELQALIVSRQIALKRKVDRAKASVARGADAEDVDRTRITDNIRQIVFQRDNGRCVVCGSTSDLQYDHIIPIALGGSSQPVNLQILCATCNQEKGAGLTSR